MCLHCQYRKVQYAITRCLFNEPIFFPDLLDFSPVAKSQLVLIVVAVLFTDWMPFLLSNQQHRGTGGYVKK